MENYFSLEYNDIFKMEADVLVFSDDIPAVKTSGALSREIYRREGLDRRELWKHWGDLLTTTQDGLTLFVTEGRRLGYKWLFHISVPDFHENILGENEQLANCYKLAIMAACELGAETAVFPLLGAGSSEDYFDPVEAYDIARSFINRNLLDLGSLRIKIAVKDRALYDKLRRFKEACDDFIIGRQFEREFFSEDTLEYCPCDSSELNEVDKCRLYKEFDKSERQRERDYDRICQEIREQREKYLAQHPDKTDKDFSREMIAKVVNAWAREPKEEYSGGHRERHERSPSGLAEMICAAPSTVTTLSACNGKFPSRELLISLAIAMKLSREERIRFILYRNEDERYPHGKKEELIESILNEYKDIPDFHTVNHRFHELTGMTIRRQAGEKPDRPERGRER